MKEKRGFPIKKGDENFRLLAENANDGILIGVGQGAHVYANPRAAEITGYSVEELLHTTTNDLAHPKEREKIAARFGSRIQGKSAPRQYETLIVTKDGETLPVEITASRTEWAGEPAVMVMLRDVSRRQRMEAEIRQNEERFRALFEGALDAVILSHPSSGKIVDANPAASDLLWIPHEEITRLHYTDLYPEKLKGLARHTFSKHVQDQEQDRPVETRILRADGSERPVEVLGQIIQISGTPVLHTTFRDISERKRAEGELRLLSNVVEQSREGIAVTDLEGNLLFVNRAFAGMHGFEQEAVLGKHLSIFHTVELLASVREAHDRLQKEGAFSGQIWHLRSDGTCFPTFMQNTLLRDDDEQPVGMIGTCRDITQWKQMEDALRASERKYRNLYSKMRDGLVAVDMQGKVVEFNATFQQMLGYSDEELFERTYREMTPEKWRALEERILREQVLVRGYSDVYEKEYIRKDGSVFQVELQTYMMRDEQGNAEGMWAMIRDVTRRKRMEKELIGVQKMESLALLAGGIAHDFNNILSAILVNLSTVRTYGELNEEDKRILEEAENAGFRAKSLTQQLLTFAKGGSRVRKTVKLSSLLRETADFVMSGSNSRCSCSVKKNLWDVEADESQIVQMVQNILINADQAMTCGGTIRLCAENVVLEEFERIPLPGGRYVRISIEDQGPGIPKEHLSRVFDPFFTTKQKGSGLGLSVCYTVVKNHEGGIYVESEPGEGTTFLVLLPASERPSKIKRKKSIKKKPGLDRILLVDDEELVGRAVGTLLRRLGYEVVHVEEGGEAVRRYLRARQDRKGFHVVIMDLTIPGGMGGVEAARKLREVDPDARILVSSGYSNDPVLGRYRDYGFDGVVVKPYRVEELAEALDRVMRLRVDSSDPDHD